MSERPDYTRCMELHHAALVMTAPLSVLVAATWLGHRPLAIVTKPLSSGIFVASGAMFLPRPDTAAAALMCGLVLSFLGDVLLIPRGRSATFALGLGSFLAAHIAYGIAFTLRGLAWPGAAAAATFLVAVGVPLARWLLPHVRGALRGPVMAYIVVITAMVVLAAGAVAAGAPSALLVGAVVFYVSDLCVARERFVTRSRWNGTVGLPLYYGAQLLLVEGMRAP